MSIHFLSAENIRKPLTGIVDSIIEQHIAHRLVDDFLIFTPDERSAEDIRQLFLKDPRLHDVLSGESILPLESWIRKTCDTLYPGTRLAPPAVLEALFRSVLQADPHFKSGHFSPESLFLLISSFREAFLSVNALRAFLESFDPELAESCVYWFLEYQKKIDNNDTLKDMSWQAWQIFKSFSQMPNLKSIRRIYYLGFLNFSPLLKLFTQHLERDRPEISQVILFQTPTGIDAQDQLSKYWEEALPRLYQFKDEAPETISTQCRSYASPFDEAGHIIREILSAVQQGVKASDIVLFLPSDPFFFDYYGQELSKLGLGLFPPKGRKLSSLKALQDLLPLSLEDALQSCANLLTEKKAHRESDFSPAPKRAEEIRALHAFQEILEEMAFYQSEFPELKNHLPSLTLLAQQHSLKDAHIAHAGVQIRSLFQPGLRRFEKSFFIQMNDSNFPRSEERFFNLSLPQFEKQSPQQKALLQHLSGAALDTFFSLSRFSLQGSEQSASSALSAYEWQEISEAKPFAFLSSTNQDLEKRLQIEILRKNDLDYQNAYGGFLQNPDLLEKFRAYLGQQTFSPSRLEDYALCPFTFFAKTLLGLQAEEEKSIEGNPLEQGRWLHEALEVFFKQNLADLEVAGTQPSLRDTLAKSLENQMLDASSRFLAEKNWVNAELFQDFTQRAIRSAQALLEAYWKRWEEGDSPQRLSPRFFEVDFGFNNPALEFRRAPLPPLRIRGKIDRIDVSADGKIMVYDYKTGDTGNLSNEIQNFKKLQLPFYLLAARQIKGLEHHEVIGALAIGLKEMTHNQGLIQSQFAKSQGIRANSKSVLNEAQWEDFWQQFVTKILDYQASMFQGDFRTKPDPCQEFCQYRSVCRYHERKKA